MEIMIKFIEVADIGGHEVYLNVSFIKAVYLEENEKETKYYAETLDESFRIQRGDYYMLIGDNRND